MQMIHLWVNEPYYREAEKEFVKLVSELWS